MNKIVLNNQMKEKFATLNIVSLFLVNNLDKDTDLQHQMAAS